MRAYLLTLVLLSAPALAQFDELPATLERLRSATLSGDYQTLVALTHPKAIAAQGGQEAALEHAEQAFLELAQSGLKHSQYQIETPKDFYPAGDDWVAFALTHSRYESASQVISEDGYLIAVRPKASADWHFIDGAGVEFPQQIYDYFPALPQGLAIPQKRSKIRLITPWSPKKNP